MNSKTYTVSFDVTITDPVGQAMRDLEKLAGEGTLEARRIALGVNWDPGFPRSVISYTLAEHMKRVNA